MKISKSILRLKRENREWVIDIPIDSLPGGCTPVSKLRPIIELDENGDRTGKVMYANKA